MKPLRCIVAGVGRLSDDDPTLLLAVDLARRCGAKLHLVHAFEFPHLMAVYPPLDAVRPEGFEEYQAELRQALEAAVRRHAEVSRDEVVCHALSGAPGQVLADTAKRLHADLLVVGAAHPSGRGHPRLGTTAQRVIRSAHVPVLVARAALYRKPGRVLLATDVSEMSAAVHERALDVLEGLYGLNGVQLRALLVLAFGMVPPPLPDEALARTAYAELGRFLDARSDRPAKVHPAVRIGEAPEQIVDEVSDWNADLLVVGTHGRHGLPRLWLGSVAEACIRDAPCSVLAVPPTPQAAPVEAVDRFTVSNAAAAV
ncbi:MAG TPA: universal stress protein [Longimicrobium sp.]|nr:universal stress protein [Longimicrobium sp.]